jgi:hypothetical protein
MNSRKSTMTAEFDVVAIVLPERGLVRVSKLTSPITDETLPMTTLSVARDNVLVRIWWPNGLPDAETQPRANLAVLAYLHDLMLEKSVENASLRAMAAELARTILASVGG